MKKSTYLIIGYLTFLSFYTQAQVTLHPGATWLFENYCEASIWKYEGDSILPNGLLSKIKVHSKNKTMGSVCGFWVEEFHNEYFLIQGDTITIITPYDTIPEIINFSLQVGDTARSPINNRLNLELVSINPDTLCDSAIVLYPAIVTEIGIEQIGGENSRFYKIKYLSNVGDHWGSTDSVFKEVKYTERSFLTASYWSIFTEFPCCFSETSNFEFKCYSDSLLPDTGKCADFTWFELLQNEEVSLKSNKMNVFPNPAQNQIQIQFSDFQPYKIEMIDLNGKIIYENTGFFSKVNSLDISSFKSGIYCIKGMDKTGNFLIRRFMKM